MKFFSVSHPNHSTQIVYAPTSDEASGIFMRHNGIIATRDLTVRDVSAEGTVATLPRPKDGEKPKVYVKPTPPTPPKKE